ncbi:hypothetical protein PM026_16850, partial [Halorubrum ezzemoulense]|nr:hypothetical protein [Halorubrum ezzemoulense]MDB2249988.1 hypothetical protein [Halorubrum ezzemoulense]
MSNGQTHTPTSILLPTVSWTPACGDVAAQLGSEDELLIIHDTEDDPVTDRERFPENVRLVPAGDPVGCSGKANAIAAGMEAAIDLLLRVNAEESHHGISGRAKRPVDFKTHTFQASSAGFQHRL